MLTNSYHHQAVKTPGEGFTVTGVLHDSTTGKDAIEATEAPNAITVQWHPETAADAGLLAGLLRAAAEHAAER